MPSGLPARHVRFGQRKCTSTELERRSSSEAEKFSFCDYTTRSVSEHPGFAAIVPNQHRQLPIPGIFVLGLDFTPHSSQNTNAVADASIPHGSVFLKAKGFFLGDEFKKMPGFEHTRVETDLDTLAIKDSCENFFDDMSMHVR
jgi:hypothetical protein